MNRMFFGSTHDSVDNLMPIERDRLLCRAFQHKALRARRLIIWISKDKLAIGDEESRHTTLESLEPIQLESLAISSKQEYGEFRSV